MMSAQRSLGVDARRDLGCSSGVEDATMNLTDMTREKVLCTYVYVYQNWARRDSATVLENGGRHSHGQR